MALYVCRFCLRSNFRSQRGLTQHQTRGACGDALELEQRAEAGLPRRAFGGTQRAELDPGGAGANQTNSTTGGQSQNPNEGDGVVLGIAGLLIGGRPYDKTRTLDGDAQFSDEEEEDNNVWGPDEDDDDAQTGPTGGNSDDPNENTEENEADSDDSVLDPEAAINTRIRRQFYEYLDRIDDDFMPLTQDEVRAIGLLDHLHKKKVPLNTYPEIMEWHLKQVQLLQEGEALSDCPHYIGRKTILQRLSRRYNFENKFPYQRKVKLPVSGEVVKITLYELEGCLQLLLTSPGVEHADYFFFEDNPMAPPPQNPTTVSDLPTGKAYLDTYQALGIDPAEGWQLMAIPLYVDGAAISHFHDQELIQVRMALGFHNRVTRTRKEAWVCIGNIERVSGGGHEGVEIMEQSNHMDVVVHQDSDGSSSSAAEDLHGVGEEPLQDLHAMLAVILEEVQDLCKTGFVWDLPYKGKVYKGLKYKVFIPFIKCDNQEADMLCGKYLVRGWNVQQLCRVCHVAVEDANDHLQRAEKKTVTEIKSLVEAKDFDGLRDISQSYIDNAFHDLRFNLGSDAGVHGACPFDMLHSCQLGTFKRCRDTFFEFVGASGSTAKKINALAIEFGPLFARQSDRTLPNCRFAHGIQKGKLMGKEYRGILLLLAAILVSAAGKEVLNQAWSRRVRDQVLIDDWILLLETLLQWEAYLCSPEMMVSDVKRLGQKHRYLMYMIRRISSRKKGMGLRTLKFHQILHLSEDILLYGVPLEADTSANEGHHKNPKAASKLTQRAASTLNIQTETRLTEMRLINLGTHEIKTGWGPWNYFDGCDIIVNAHEAWNEPVEESSEEDSRDQEVEDRSNDGEGMAEGGAEAHAQEEGIEKHTGEARIHLFKDENERRKCKLLSRSKYGRKTRWEQDLVNFLWDLQDCVQAHIPTRLQVYTCHKRGKTIFRGHPNFRGKGPWKDWAIFDWGAYGKVPCHIWCFVVLEGLPDAFRSEFGGIRLKNGTYAVVESTQALENEGVSTFFRPIGAESELNADGKISRRIFYLADTDAIESECAVIPDIGGPINRYFHIKPRSEWAEEFLQWVRQPHHLDQMDPLDDNDGVVDPGNTMADAEDEEDDENRNARRRRLG